MSECVFNEKHVGVWPAIQWLGIVATSMLACMVARAQPSPAPSKPTLSSILSDRTLWGKDFPLALASLQSAHEVGERRVAIFPTRIVGGTAFKTREDAEQTSRTLTEAMAAREFKPKPEFEAMFRAIGPRPAELLKAEIIPAFADDDSIRVAWTRPEAEFLPPKLTVAAVQKRLGPPEKVETEVIQSEGERRPTVLTLYRYADGAVSFAESDIAAQPGLVDRVLLDAPAVMSTLFE
jgi:hypothetical protein